MKHSYKVLVIVTLALITGNLFAQESGAEEPEFKNSFLLNFGYTHVPGGSEFESESSGGVFVPTIGFDYGREISENWELLLMLHYLYLYRLSES